MVVLWYEYVVIAAIISGVLTAFAGITFGFLRVRVQKWVGGAIGNFMTNLANQAAEEGGQPSLGGGPSGPLELGGFKIDPRLIGMAIEYGPQLLKLAEQFGLVKGGGGSTGGSGL